jgi:23S rRNA G2069 N7-methylase RlmK/C1962 C5-methylase RlmI
MDAFACVRCGRIEFYARDDVLKKCISDTVRVMAADRESSNKSNNLAAQLTSLKKELEHCVERSKDDDLTDDEAKELEGRILDLYNKINVIEHKLASLKG